MSARRLTLFVVVSACAAAGCLLSGGGVALAKEVHVYRSSFGVEGSGPGDLRAPAGVAVDDSTELGDPAAGDVYVVDAGNDRVERFSADGAFLGQFDGGGAFEVEGKVEAGPAAPTGVLSEPTEVAVDDSGSSLDPSAGDVYVVDRGHGVIDKFSALGAYLGQLTGTPPCTEAHPCTSGGPFGVGEASHRKIEGVAVDPSGTLWVSIGVGPIYSFSDALENKYESELETAFGGALDGLAVDAEDNLYLNAGSSEFVKVSSAGKTLANPFGETREAFRVAVDPVHGEVYLDNRGAGESSLAAFTLGGAPIETFGAGHLPGADQSSVGVAVNASDGTVYASDRAEGVVAVFEGLTLPSVSVGALSGQSPRGVTLNGTVDPEGKPVTSCVFEYATAAEYEASKGVYGHSVPCTPAGLGSGTAPVPVSARLEGLVPQTVYHYRLVAQNAAPVSSPTADQELFTGPRSGVQFVTGVTASSATLHASIDPNGADTHYYFEYGRTLAYGSFAPADPPGEDLGSAVGVQNVSVHLQNLTAGVDYHYRLVAVQDGETFEDADESFSTQAAGTAAGLADGRGWELVSPSEKQGALIELFESGGQVQAADDGSGITYLTQGPSVGENPTGNLLYAQVLSKRTGVGWQTQNLVLPNRLPEAELPAEFLLKTQLEYRLFSPDLSQAVVEPQEAGTPPLAPEIEKERTLYLRENTDGSFQPLVSAANVLPEAKIDESVYKGGVHTAFQLQFLASTPDLHHIVLKTALALVEPAIDEEHVQEVEKPGFYEANVQWNLYEWNDGQLQLINVLPNGQPAHGRFPAVPPVRLAGVGSSVVFGRGSVQRAVSNNGRYVAWTFGEPYEGHRGSDHGRLFVRDMVEERTVQLGGERALYQTMSSDGSKVFYLEEGDLYLYDFRTGTTTNLTADHGPSETNGGVKELVSDVSEDGSYVYFVATGILANGGVSGQPNLYLLHDAATGWSTTHIATLSPADEPTWYGTKYGAPYTAGFSSRVSPDGRYLAFMSQQPLTGYDNTDALSGQPDEEVYLYDGQTNNLICASCNPTNARPHGVLDEDHSALLIDRPGIWTEDSSSGENHVAHWLAGSIPAWDDLDNDPATYQPRYLSDSGRLFFDSPDALVPHDTNGLEDVYEYEPQGVGNCTPATATGTQVYVAQLAGKPEEGCVALISSGTSSAESAFFDASENGDDVFFATTAQLAPQDHDTAYDVYDAHVCTSAIPCNQPPTAPPACNSGDSCKAAPTPQPEIFGPTPTATFHGSGNATPTTTTNKTTTKTKQLKCKRGFVEKRHRCVRKRKKSKRARTKRASGRQGVKR